MRGFRAREDAQKPVDPGLVQDEPGVEGLALRRGADLRRRQRRGHRRWRGDSDDPVFVRGGGGGSLRRGGVPRSAAAVSGSARSGSVRGGGGRGRVVTNRRRRRFLATRQRRRLRLGNRLDPFGDTLRRDADLRVRVRVEQVADGAALVDAVPGDARRVVVRAHGFQRGLKATETRSVRSIAQLDPRLVHAVPLESHAFAPGAVAGAAPPIGGKRAG